MLETDCLGESRADTLPDKKYQTEYVPTCTFCTPT